MLVLLNIVILPVLTNSPNVETIGLVEIKTNKIAPNDKKLINLNLFIKNAYGFFKITLPNSYYKYYTTSFNSFNILIIVIYTLLLFNKYLII